MKRLAMLLALLAPSLAIAGPDFGGSPKSAKGAPDAASDGSKDVLPMDDVTFANDSAQLLPAAQAQVKTAAGWLGKHEKTKIVLEGHADSTGRKAYNEDLATRRLQSVRDALRTNGVNVDRIVMVVYGEVGAQKPENLNDRRVILFASKDSVADIVRGSLTVKHALSAVWTEKGTLHTETAATQTATPPKS